jgi:hypothetical protein
LYLPRPPREKRHRQARFVVTMRAVVASSSRRRSTVARNSQKSTEGVCFGPVYRPNPRSEPRSYPFRAVSKRPWENRPWMIFRLCPVAPLYRCSRSARHVIVDRATGCFQTHVSALVPTSPSPGTASNEVRILSDSTHTDLRRRDRSEPHLDGVRWRRVRRDKDAGAPGL